MNVEEIFNEFIQVVKENDNYRIGLLSHEGYIRYCSDDKLRHSLIDIDKVDKESLLYPLDISKEDIAYLWINSEDANKKIVGNLIAESLKTRLVYEQSVLETQQSVSNDERLINLLIAKSSIAREQLKELSHQISYRVNNDKVAILVAGMIESLDKEDLARFKFLTEKYHAIFTKKQDTLIIFMDLMGPSYVQEIDQFIKEMQKWGLNQSHYYVGSVQNQLSRYLFSYESAQWLSKQKMEEKKVYFFKDYLFDYVLYDMDLNFEKELFIGCENQLSKDVQEEFIEIAEALYTHDFNISKAAEALYLHKNTLLYRLNKLEALVGINFRASFQGKVIFYMLARRIRKLMN